ncbi:MAG TPA: Hsp70 family protein, partial [Rhizomicrobium sp.]|nr:Hsp70 family protein [Rhizomicrobium sp.]
EPEKVARLLKTIRRHLGHRIAFAVEDAKIALSEAQPFSIPLDFLESGLGAETTQARFEHAIRDRLAKLTAVAADCVSRAGVRPDQIQTIFFTGGSSRVPSVQCAISRAAPRARGTTGSDFLSVALGLTREAQRRFG